MSNYSAYDLFDLYLSHLMQQLKFMREREMFIELEFDSYKKKAREAINHSMFLFFLNKHEIEDVRKSIEDIRVKMGSPVKYFIKRKLRVFAGELAPTYTEICAAVKNHFRKKKLQDTLRSLKRNLKYKTEVCGVDLKKMFNSILAKCEVASSAIQFLEGQIQERERAIESKLQVCKGECAVCWSEEGSLVKIECKHLYHIKCINAVLTSDVIEGIMAKAKCVTCGDIL